LVTVFFINRIMQQAPTCRGQQGVGQADGIGSDLGGAKGGPEPLLHLASDFQRRQAAEDVPARATFLPHPHRPNFRQARLQGAEVALHLVE
jgi:hypothetical protein